MPTRGQPPEFIGAASIPQAKAVMVFRRQHHIAHARVASGVPPSLQWVFWLVYRRLTRCRRSNLSPQPPPLEGRGSRLFCFFCQRTIFHTRTPPSLLGKGVGGLGKRAGGKRLGLKSQVLIQSRYCRFKARLHNMLEHRVVIAFQIAGRAQRHDRLVGAPSPPLHFAEF